uniref:Putative secreted protein n=1 Tax=Anopheles marajoara TaxID=58244 RepID=A0A2M4CA38_9DIPT
MIVTYVCAVLVAEEPVVDGSMLTWIIVVLWPSRCSLAADGTSIQAPTAGPLPAQPEPQMIAERFRTILLTHFPNRRDPLRPVLLAVRH